MGEVVRFCARTALHSAVPLTFGALSAKFRVITSDLEDARTTITGSEAVARVALIRLNEYRDALHRTSAFCARCSDATELDELDEMVRARDRLLTDLGEIERLWPQP